MPKKIMELDDERQLSALNERKKQLLKALEAENALITTRNRSGLGVLASGVIVVGIVLAPFLPGIVGPAVAAFLLPIMPLASIPLLLLAGVLFALGLTLINTSLDKSNYYSQELRKTNNEIATIEGSTPHPSSSIQMEALHKQKPAEVLDSAKFSKEKTNSKPLPAAQEKNLNTGSTTVLETAANTKSSAIPEGGTNTDNDRNSPGI